MLKLQIQNYTLRLTKVHLFWNLAKDLSSVKKTGEQAAMILTVIFDLFRQIIL